jgi:predicted amino acid racemase
MHQLPMVIPWCFCRPYLADNHRKSCNRYNKKTSNSKFGIKLRYISGGNSSSLNLIASGKIPRAVNHIRIGEGILLGRETVNRAAWPGTFQDAFLLQAEMCSHCLGKKSSRFDHVSSTTTSSFTKIPRWDNSDINAS